MFLRSLLVIISFTSAIAAVSSQSVTKNKSHTYKQQYKIALETPGSKQSCQTFLKLSKTKNFLLKDLAQLRHAENCTKKTDWAALYKTLSSELLTPVLVKAWYNYEINKKHFGNAYRVFNKNRYHISIDKKEFELMATKALQTRLTKKEKSALRKELYKKSPRFLPRPKKSDYARVARDFRKDRQFEKALKYYRKIINDPKASYHRRWQAFKGARITYKLERWTRMKKYIKSSKQWANFLRKKYKWSKEMTRLHHDANIEYVRTLWTERGQTQAKKELKRLESEVKGRHSLQVVYWLLGRMEEESKNYKKAVYWLNKAAKEKVLSNRDHQRVLWALAWNQRRIGQYQNSQQTLETLKKHPDITFFAKSKYLYWQAENIESMNQISKAKTAFRHLAELDLYGYYGALAYRKLNESFPAPPKPNFQEKDLLSFFTTADQRLFTNLIQVGELEIAEKLTLSKIKTNKQWSSDKWVKYLSLLQKSGAYKTSFIRYHTLEPRIQLNILKEHPYLLFPRPFQNEVATSARQSLISSALIYSIMKQESGFDVKARSHADAFGLLQLIPEVAQKAAKRMPSVNYSKPYDLYKPNVIIPLGANSLRHLFSKFNSNFIISVASYNANEKAVKGWIKTRFSGDPITFIEDIPYEETKGYVKLVMRNYIAYNRFEAKEQNFVFPEVCLQGLQSFKR